MLERVLGHRYRLIERIGNGGMAEVYRAEDTLLDRIVAVKILHSHFTGDSEFVHRFRREARAAARLSHPHVVNVYDVGCDEDIHFIVMEYIDGETLKELIDRSAPLDNAVAVDIAIQILSALKHAHDNHVVHCDIKPHNILISHDGSVKVADFGIARAATSHTATQVLDGMGSVHYVSPEQAQGGVVDAKSDIYSMGVVLYEMLAGVTPFKGETPIGIALKHIQEEPPLLRDVNPKVTSSLESFVSKAMAKEPALRFEDASKALVALELIREHPDHTFAILHLGKLPFKLRLRKIPTRVWAISGLLLAGFFLGTFLAIGNFWGGRELPVPSVTGKQIEIARSILANENLRVQISERFDDKAAVGIVISQDPAAGIQVKENRVVNIVVSKGAEMLTIPDLKGLIRRDAEAQIRSAGLKVGRVEEQFAAGTAPDSVISQNPRPPGQIAKGVMVDLVVSKGTSPRQLVVPDFYGQSFYSVMTRLETLKLRLGKVTEVSSGRLAPGVVNSQTPVPGSTVSEGATIEFEVVKGGGGVPKRFVIQTSVPDGPIRQSVQIIVFDGNGRRVVYEGVHKPGERIEKVIEGTGQVTVQVFANGHLIQEQII